MSDHLYLMMNIKGFVRFDMSNILRVIHNIYLNFTGHTPVPIFEEKDRMWSINTNRHGLVNASLCIFVVVLSDSLMHLTMHQSEPEISCFILRMTFS